MALTEERLREIRASITVYDFVDGREVNRRKAFPISAIGHAFMSIKVSMKGFGDAMNQLAEIAGRMCEPIAYEPHKSVTLRRVQPGQRASASAPVTTRSVPPVLRGTAGLE